jgi:hypothetical protein
MLRNKTEESATHLHSHLQAPLLQVHVSARHATMLFVVDTAAVCCGHSCCLLWTQLLLVVDTAAACCELQCLSHKVTPAHKNENRCANAARDNTKQAAHLHSHLQARLLQVHVQARHGTMLFVVDCSASATG